MPERLSSMDASFLYLEEPMTAMHVGSVMVFRTPAEGFSYDDLLALVSNRIAYVPRYRQRIRRVPVGLGAPVWVDDESFDLTYHVRRSALPRPGTQEQLAEFVARIQSRVLDRERPLWEVYLVEGLSDGRFAIVSKSHQAMVDGVHAIDIGQVIVDADAVPVSAMPQTWRPSPEPSDIELLARAAVDAVRRPGQAVDTVRSGWRDLRRAGARVADAAGRAASTLARSAARPAPASPLNAHIGEARRFLMVSTDLEDIKAVRTRRVGGREPADVTVNDVVLATVTGALRAWLLTRGEPVHPSSTVRAMVPVSVLDPQSSSRLGNRVTACFVDLPVGEPSPGMRLQQIAYSMRQQMEGGHAVPAGALAELAGFAPPTLHSLGARVGNAVSRRLFNLVITNVPGPQHALYAGDARMLATFPVIPLARGQALTIGLTSYDGGLYFGLNGDRYAMADIDVLGQCLLDAIAEITGRGASW